MSVKVKYKGEQILSLNTDTEKALSTMGQYCEDDITIENVQDGGITPSGSITLTEERSYDVTEKATAVVDMSATRANLAEAVTAKGVDTLPTSSFDTIATNIGLISGGGLPSSISKIDSGSFTIESDTQSYNYSINHNLGNAPKMVILWTEDENLVNSTNAQTRNYLFSVILFNNPFLSGTATQAFTLIYQYRATNGNASATSGGNITTAQMSTYFTATTFKLTLSTAWYKAGVTYKWIAWA